MHTNLVLSTNDPRKTPGERGLSVQALVKLSSDTDGPAITFLNDTGQALSGFRVAVDAALVAVARPTQGGCGAKGGVMTCELSWLPPGQSVSIDLEAGEASATRAKATPFELAVRDADAALYTGILDGQLVFPE